MKTPNTLLRVVPQLVARTWRAEDCSPYPRKTKTLFLRATQFVFAVALLSGPALVLAQQARLPSINPVTGMPLSSDSTSAGLAPIDPATGLPKLPGELTPADAITAAYQVANEVERLTFNQRYDEALKSCLAFHEKWRTSAFLSPLLPKWVELGRRYPAAKAALEDLRDLDTREFEEGRGFFALFQEVSSINQHLGQEEATYELFMLLRQKDPRLADQCYGLVEGLLVAHREYQYCYDHLPNPKARFDLICRDYNERLERYARSEALNRQTQEQIAAKKIQLGLPDSAPVARLSSHAQLEAHARNSFVGQTRQLVEILIGTGHKADADQIIERAIEVVDDQRLRSAAADAINRK